MSRRPRPLTFLLAFAAVSCLCLPLQSSAAQAVTHPLFAVYDLDTPTEVADTNQVVVSVDWADGALALAAQPDVPRNLTSTLTDGDTSCSGTLTFVGLDVDGNALTDAVTAAQARAGWTGTNVYASVTSATISSASGCGAGADTVVVGTGSTVAPIYCSLGDPRDGSGGQIKTTGTSSTTDAVTGTPFDLVAVGDQITVQIQPAATMIRYVASKASGAQITVRAAGQAADAWSLPATLGYPWSYRTQSCGYGLGSGWVPAPGSSTLYLALEQLSATGGVVASLECRVAGGPPIPIQLWTSTYTTAILPGQPGGYSLPVGEDCEALRLGLRFGTNDDATDTDATATREQITASIYEER